jgi:hypothetical protein
MKVHSRIHADATSVRVDGKNLKKFKIFKKIIKKKSTSARTGPTFVPAGPASARTWGPSVRMRRFTPEVTL